MVDAGNGGGLAEIARAAGIVLGAGPKNGNFLVEVHGVESSYPNKRRSVKGSILKFHQDWRRR